MQDSIFDAKGHQSEQKFLEKRILEQDFSRGLKNGRLQRTL
jgi:hypothetical protein